MKKKIIHYKSATIKRGTTTILKDIDFELNEGEFVFLVGKVGTGKSTLLKSFYGETEVERAIEASVLDYDMLNLSKKEIPTFRRQMGIIFQDFQLLPDMTIVENLDFVLRAIAWKRAAERRNRIREVLELVEFTDGAFRRPHELSGGEKQRIVIARALLNNPRLIIADEPTGSLDAENGLKITRLLHSLTKKGQAVVMSTHNFDLVQRFPARNLTCSDNRISENKVP